VRHACRKGRPCERVQGRYDWLWRGQEAPEGKDRDLLRAVSRQAKGAGGPTGHGRGHPSRRRQESAHRDPADDGEGSQGHGVAVDLTMDFAAQKYDALLDYLRRHVDGEVRFDAMTRRLYSTDASISQTDRVGAAIPKTPAALQTAVQIALEMHIPIVPRGGGTSLSGQSIGPGVVLDCSKYLNNILEIEPALPSARVQPGVILDQLNRALAVHGLQFGPDVATASRANLGGMIGNNAAGSHSIVHGKTIDHVRTLRVLLSDGKPADLGPLSVTDWRRQDEHTFLGMLHRQVRQIVLDAAPEIQRRFPRILR